MKHNCKKSVRKKTAIQPYLENAIRGGWNQDKKVTIRSTKSNNHRYPNIENSLRGFSEIISPNSRITMR